MEDMLRSLCTAEGAGGLAAAAEKAAAYLHEVTDDVKTDALGNVMGIRRCGREGASLLLLEAHIDEVGFIVTGIDESGFVRVAPCGGADIRTVPAAEVILWADKPVQGVFGSVPPHLSNGEKKLPDWPELGIDIGLDAKRAAKRVPLGTRGTFRPHFEDMSGGRVCAKALDDRAGVTAVLACLQELRGEELPWDVAALFAVQEELGCRGAAVAAFALHPALAIATDVSFAYTPDAPRAKCGELGKGPMLGWAPSLDRRLTQRLEALAKEEGIAIQHEVMGGDTGTDADSISGAQEGIPTALLSIPLRYMHTPCEVIQRSDMEAVGRLMAAFARKGGDVL